MTTLKSSLIAALGAALLGAAPGHAIPFTVFAQANSSGGGSGLATVALSAGQVFSVTAATTDLWSAGALPRYSNANGLLGNLYATGSDESGQAAGTLIGAAFPLWTQDGFTAPYGSLVGRIGSSYVLLGAGYTGAAPVAGMLNLYYWDSNMGDNFGSIKVDVAVKATTVPEPGTFALAGLGLLLLGVAALRRKA
jgi:hypothetical protein